ncbi:MATE family efflux transporter [Alistipes sp. ZOR0009]|uniref:MATE family efflux transporter n=1 Tax=Alistipes sp. ZOR0009 TaxID=1339253 RepID=UPI000648F1B6|nr:MATE family efflux transporter [Alistipes sp. ZOR0009]
MKRFWRLYRPHYRSTLSLGLPVMVSQLGQISVAVVDVMMIGRLGAIPLAAAAFATMLVSLPLYFGMGFALSITPLTGKAFGANNHREVGVLWKNGVVSYLSVGLLLLLISAILYGGMAFMNQPDSIIPLARPFFILIAISMFPVMIFMLGKQVLEGLGDTRTAMVITLIANLINIVGNYLLIYGNLGMPTLGVNGAGVSTLTARTFMAVAIMVVALRKPILRQALQLAKDVKASFSQVKRIYKLGVPMGMQVFSEASAFIFAGLMMGWLGEIGLAAHQVVISLSGLGFMLYQAIGMSTTIRVSQLSALGTPSIVRRASVASSQIAGVMVVVISGLFLLFHKEIPYLFTQDEAVALVASKLLIVFIIFQVFDAGQIVFSGILRGLADARIPSMLTFVSYYLISIPISYLAAFKLGFGEVGIWMGFPIGLGICALLFYFRIRILMGRLELARA